MHPDERALRRAVCAAPEDDLPRLVYADYLEERGDGRQAAFIRAQCEQAREVWGSRRWRELGRLAHAVRPAADAWSESLVDLAEDGEFVRGFVGRAVVTPTAFITSGAELFEREPVETVELTGLSLAEFDQPPFRQNLRAVRNLDLTRASPSFSLYSLLNAAPEHLAELEGLALWQVRSQWEPPLARLLTALPRLARLSRPNGGWSGGHLLDLLGCPAFARVAELEATGGADAVAALAASPHTTGLRRLRLHAAARDFAGLAGAGGLAGLEVLELVHPFTPPANARPRNYVPPEQSLRPLAAAPFAPTLKVVAVRADTPPGVLDRLREAFPAADIYAR